MKPRWIMDYCWGRINRIWVLHVDMSQKCRIAALLDFCFNVWNQDYTNHMMTMWATYDGTIWRMSVKMKIFLSTFSMWHLLCLRWLRHDLLSHSTCRC